MLKRSYAKINLTLDVIGKDESGFHLIQTVFQEIGLCDEMSFEKIDSGIDLSCSDPSIPTDNKNLVYKAISALGVEAEKKTGPSFDRGYDVPDSGQFGGVKIYINKKIPVGAGLGGGSSNAATALKACNELWELNWPLESLAKIGSRIGMDVPFFIHGGTALGAHYGEQIEPFPRSPELNLVVIYPGEISETKNAYDLLDIEKTGKNIEKSRGLLADLIKSDDQIIGYVSNDFETLIDEKKWGLGKSTEKIKEDLEDCGAQATCLAGSGSAVYGIFPDDLAAKSAAIKLEKKYPFCWPGKSIGA